MPIATALVDASRSTPACRATPALASANSGTISQADQGRSVCSTRASGETASFESHARWSHAGASASGGCGSSTVSSAVRFASALTAAGRWNGSAGVSRPRTTPAIVGCTPAS